MRTETGNELARVTLIDFSYRTLIDRLVRPKRAILDYNTRSPLPFPIGLEFPNRFSGITEAILRNVSTSLEDIQAEFLTIVHKDDILIGHSLENDLNALKVALSPISGAIKALVDRA